MASGNTNLDVFFLVWGDEMGPRELKLHLEEDPDGRDYDGKDDEIVAADLNIGRHRGDLELTAKEIAVAMGGVTAGRLWASMKLSSELEPVVEIWLHLLKNLESINFNNDDVRFMLANFAARHDRPLTRAEVIQINGLSDTLVSDGKKYGFGTVYAEQVAEARAI